MLKTLLFVVIATVQCLEVKEKLKEDPVIRYQPPTQQDQRLDGFRPRSDWSYYFPSWSHYFKDDDDVDESPDLLKRLTAIEQVVKELNDLLKKESIGLKKPESPATPSNKVEAASPIKDSPPKMPMDRVPPKNEKKPAINNKPTQPEKNTQPSETINESKKPESVEKPEGPVKATETTHDANPSKEPLPAEEIAPPQGDEE